MNRLLTLSALILLTGAVACGDTSDDSAATDNNTVNNGKGDQVNNTTQTASLQESIAQCDAYRDAQLELPENESTAGLLQVVSTHAQCLQQANDTTIAHIQALNEELGFDIEIDVATTFAQYRAFQTSFCNVTVPAGELGQGTMGGVILQSCFADVEADLSKLILNYVEFDTEPVYTNLEDFRENHADCFGAYDTQMENAMNQAEMNGAIYELSTCIDLENEARIPELAQGLVEFGHETDVDAATEGIQSVFAGAKEWSGSLCGELVSASSERGGSITGLYSGECLALTAIWRAKLIKESLTGF